MSSSKAHDNGVLVVTLWIALKMNIQVQQKLPFERPVTHHRWGLQNYGFYSQVLVKFREVRNNLSYQLRVGLGISWWLFNLYCWWRLISERLYWNQNDRIRFQVCYVCSLEDSSIKNYLCMRIGSNFNRVCLCALLCLFEWNTKWNISNTGGYIW